jgi:integrase
LSAYRYRIAGRGSARLQAGGFNTKADAQRALQNKLARLLPGGRPATLTLGEWVEEYLDAHHGEREQRPFDSWAQIRSLAERLGSSFGPMVTFAAATGLRPSELFAIEHGDIDRAAGVVQIRRAYATGGSSTPRRG